MKDIQTQAIGITFAPQEMNDIIDELENIIKSAGITLTISTGEDVNQLGKAIATYATGGWYYSESGSADAYIVAPNGLFKAPEAYFNGMVIRFRAGNANTGASTINVASLGLKNIKLADGSSDPSAGDIGTASDTLLVYDGTNFRIGNIKYQRLDVVGNVAVGGSLSVTGAFSPSKVTVTSDAGGTPDANTIYKKNICKGWINFNGTGTIAIRDSFNVSSIVDNGPGNYTINWDRDFADANYCSVGSVRHEPPSGTTRAVYIFSSLVSSLQIKVYDGTSALTDLDVITVVAFGNQ